MSRGIKIDNKKIAEVITSYALTNSYNATAKECGVSANSVKNIITKQKKENSDEFEKICKEKKETFVQKADKIIDKAMDKLDKSLDKEDIAPNQLTTVIGTLVDKKRLVAGETTENNKFEVNIKVVE